jgi:hypothetical protein
VLRIVRHNNFHTTQSSRHGWCAGGVFYIPRCWRTPSWPLATSRQLIANRAVSNLRIITPLDIDSDYKLLSAGSATVLRDGGASTSMAGVWTDPFEVLAADGYVAPREHFHRECLQVADATQRLPPSQGISRTREYACSFRIQLFLNRSNRYLKL